MPPRPFAFSESGRHRRPPPALPLLSASPGSTGDPRLPGLCFQRVRAAPATPACLAFAFSESGRHRRPPPALPLRGRRVAGTPKPGVACRLMPPRQRYSPIPSTKTALSVDCPVQLTARFRKTTLFQDSHDTCPRTFHARARFPGRSCVFPGDLPCQGPFSWKVLPFSGGRTAALPSPSTKMALLVDEPGKFGAGFVRT